MKRIMLGLFGLMLMMPIPLFADVSLPPREYGEFIAKEKWYSDNLPCKGEEIRCSTETDIVTKKKLSDTCAPYRNNPDYFIWYHEGNLYSTSSTYCPIAYKASAHEPPTVLAAPSNDVKNPAVINPLFVGGILVISIAGFVFLLWKIRGKFSRR